MKLLIIDNNMDPACWGAADLCRGLSEVELEVRRGPHEDLPRIGTLEFNQYRGVIVSGSRESCLSQADWVKKLDQVVLEFIKLNKPVLGVCFGHQTIARAMGGVKILRKAQAAEFGWTEIKHDENSRLLKGLKNPFFSYSAHFEEVFELPVDFKKTASSQRCQIQAMEHNTKPIFGIQFHPEKDIDDAEKTFAERIKAGQPKELLGLGQSKKRYDPTLYNTILQNFLSL